MSLVPITDVCDFQGGTQPPKSEWSDKAQEGYVRMLQIRDFTQRERNTPEYVKDAKKLKKCSVDDVLIGRYGASVGKILRGLAGAYNVAIVRSIPDESKITKDFLYYLFKGPVFQNFILSVGERAAQAGFNKTDLTKFKIALLPLNDQKRIANLLGKVEGLINQRKQSIQQLDELVKSVFLDMFGDPVKNDEGWEPTNIASCTDIQSGQVDPITPPYSEMLHVGGANIESASGCFINLKKAKNENLISGKYLFDSDYILYSKIRPYLNKVSKPNFVGICSADIYPIKPKDGLLNRDFLRVLLMSTSFLSYAAGKSTRANIPKINRKALDAFSFNRPPIAIQNQFSAIVEKIEKIKSQYLETLSDLEAFYGALSQKAFKGELDLSRVPLPDENILDNTRVEQLGKQAENNVENTILTFSQFDADDLNDIELRKAQFGKWFKEWLEQYKKESDLNINYFWKCVDFTTQDYLDENDNPFEVGLGDYDHIKSEIFDAIKNGSIEQTTNMIEVVDKVTGKKIIEPGNQILLKKRH